MKNTQKPTGLLVSRSCTWTALATLVVILPTPTGCASTDNASPEAAEAEYVPSEENLVSFTTDRKLFELKLPADDGWRVKHRAGTGVALKRDDGGHFSANIRPYENGYRRLLEDHIAGATKVDANAECGGIPEKLDQPLVCKLQMESRTVETGILCREVWNRLVCMTNRQKSGVGRYLEFASEHLSRGDARMFLFPDDGFVFEKAFVESGYDGWERATIEQPGSIFSAMNPATGLTIQLVSTDNPWSEVRNVGWEKGLESAAVTLQKYWIKNAVEKSSHTRVEGVDDKELGHVVYNERSLRWTYATVSSAEKRIINRNEFPAVSDSRVWSCYPMKKEGASDNVDVEKKCDKFLDAVVHHGAEFRDSGWRWSSLKTDERSKLFTEGKLEGWSRYAVPNADILAVYKNDLAGFWSYFRAPPTKTSTVEAARKATLAAEASSLCKSRHAENVTECTVAFEKSLVADATGSVVHYFTNYDAEKGNPTSRYTAIRAYGPIKNQYIGICTSTALPESEANSVCVKTLLELRVKDLKPGLGIGGVSGKTPIDTIQ